MQIALDEGYKGTLEPATGTVYPGEVLERATQ